MNAPQSQKSDSAEPTRRCALTRASLPTSRLIRFVVAPDRNIVPDVAAKLPGRGLWLRAERDIVDKACSANLFAKASGENVVQPSGLSDRLEELLAARCLDLIGLARRAGQAVAGYEKARRALGDSPTTRGDGAVLVLASDGPPDECRKISAFAPGALVVRTFDGAELGAVFGRDRVVYAVVSRGPFADRIGGEVRRLQGFRLGPEAGKLN